MGTLILGGTTAAGKSALSVEIAERFNARIVSADAMTVYRQMNVGTAKPPDDILARIPHACIDVRNPDEAFSVADFVAAFEAEVAAHPHVLVVGGTPFYLAALVRPLAAMPAADPVVRASLEALPDAHARLTQIDPQSAERLHPNDRMRIIRALEVHAISGKTLTQLHAEGGRMRPVECECVWMDRDDLADRIESRLQQMVEDGYVAEVEGLLESGWDPSLKPMHSFGYRHMVACVQGEFDLTEGLRRTARDTWRFARKQRTWARGMEWEAATREDVLEAAKRAFEVA